MMYCIDYKLANFHLISQIFMPAWQAEDDYLTISDALVEKKMAFWD